MNFVGSFNSISPLNYFLKMLKWIPFDRPETALQFCFWVLTDWTKRLAANSRKWTAGVNVFLSQSTIFAIFAQNWIRVVKIMKNREKSAESNKQFFRILKLYFRVEITIIKLKNSIKIHLIVIKFWKFDFRNQRQILYRMMCKVNYFELIQKMVFEEPIRKQILQLQVSVDLAARP